MILSLIPGEWVSVESSEQSTDTPSRRSASWNISESSTRTSSGLLTLVLISGKKKKMYTPDHVTTDESKKKICRGMDKKMFQYKSLLTILSPSLVFYPSLTACVKPGGTGAAMAGSWAETLLCSPLTFLLHGGHLGGDTVLACVCFDSGAAGGVSGQTGAALTALRVQVQVITDVWLSVTLLL